MSGEGGVAGEGRAVGVPKFYSWGRCTMPLMNITSDRISNTSSGLCIDLYYNILFTWVLYFAFWGVIIHTGPLFCILGCSYFRGFFILHFGV